MKGSTTVYVTRGLEGSISSHRAASRVLPDACQQGGLLSTSHGVKIHYNSTSLHLMTKNGWTVTTKAGGRAASRKSQFGGGKLAGVKQEGEPAGGPQLSPEKVKVARRATIAANPSLKR